MSGGMLGVQGGAELSERFHFIRTLAFATPRPKDTSETDDVHIYQYDAGAEYFHPFYASSQTTHWTIRPFVGAGLGARTYDLQHSTVASHTDFTGYGSLGTELQHVNNHFWSCGGRRYRLGGGGARPALRPKMGYRDRVPSFPGGTSPGRCSSPFGTDPPGKRQV